MTNNTTRRSVPARWATFAAAAVAAAALAGCRQNKDARVNGATFHSPDEPTSVQRFAEVQMAAGARTDGTLRAHDFDGGDINSLGRQKIDLMLKDDDACNPLVVYVDLPKDDATDARNESVQAYLKDRGLTPAQIKLVAGPNTRTLHPTAPALRAKKLLDTGATVATNPEPAGSAGGPALGGK